MPSALALESKFENSSVAAKNRIDIPFLSRVNLFFFSVASLHTANENIEVIRVSLNRAEVLSSKTNPMLVPDCS